MCAMQLDSIEGKNGKVQMNITKGAVAKSKGKLVMPSLTKNVQRHDPSKLLRILSFSETMLLSLYKAFRNAVINFSGTKAPPPCQLRGILDGRDSLPPTPRNGHLKVQGAS